METVKNMDKFILNLFIEEQKSLRSGIFYCTKRIEKLEKYPSEKWQVKEYKIVRAKSVARLAWVKKHIEFLKKMNS